MSNQTGYTLRMERIFAAPRQLVFDYFTKPELIKTWFGPSGTVAESVEIDLQVGGVCRWHMKTAEGQRVLLFGSIKELTAPERVVMTHEWQGSNIETVVTLEFIDLGDKTKLRLTHEGLTSADLIPLYREGWGKPFEQLDKEIRRPTG